MSKLELAPLTTGYRSVQLLNSDLTAIEEAFENTLSRDGTGPNQMEADLDLNSHKIINLPEPTSGSEAATKTYADGVRADVEEALTDTLAAQLAAEGARDAAQASQAAAATSAASAATSASSASSSATTAYNAARALMSITSYGVVGDGITDDTTAVTNAVAAAYASGADLYWPAGTYLTTASIPNFHSVRHRGPGAVKRNSQLFYVEPVGTTVENIIWVGASGSDTNDGLSSNFPLREFKTAATLLGNYNDCSGSAWTLQDFTGGTFKGGILIPRGFGKRNFVKIKGASATHPNPSTTIISKTADTSATYGISATDGTLLWLENIKVSGAFAQGVYVSKNVYLQWRNVHVDGAVCGLQLNVHCRYFVTGGKISNCTNYGINELFHITRSFDTVSAASDGLIIEFAGKTGLKAKENCVGHMDYLNIQDCPVGVEMQLYSGANVGNLNLKRCTLGIMLVNSEVHEYTSAVWGTGVDACTRRVKRRGNSSVIEMFGWTPDGGLTVTQGQAAPIKLASMYTQTTVTGTTTETDVANWVGPLKQDFYSVAGTKYTVRVSGRVGASALTGTSRILLRVGGTFMTDVTLPIGTPANAFWDAEWDVTCTADGAFQLVRSRLLVEGTSSAGLADVTMIARTVDMSTADKGVIVSMTNTQAADSNTVWIAELHG